MGESAAVVVAVDGQLGERCECRESWELGRGHGERVSEARESLPGSKLGEREIRGMEEPIEPTTGDYPGARSNECG